MHTNKEVGVQISKRRYILGSYKGEVARLHTLLYVFALKTLLVPPNAPLDGRDWLTSPIAADISCCLTGCPIVFFMVNRPQNV
jgi:hypothetical protein